MSESRFGANATREAHMATCKQRALEYLPHEPQNAVASMCSDLTKHPETDNPATQMLRMVGMMEISNGSAAVERWINGFN